MDKILSIAIKSGYFKFVVIDIWDSILIKRHYPHTRVLLMNRLTDKELLLCELFGIEVALLDISDLERIKKYNVNLQIEINSGMNRFGISINEISNIEGVTIVGIYSHNATMVKRFIKKQLRVFEQALDFRKPLDIHYQASSLISCNISFTNCKRIGEFIYKDSITFTGKIIKILFVKKGSHVGYNYSYNLRKDSYVGIIDIGYSDGLERKCNGFKVYINGKFYKMIGLACMNQAFVLIDKNVKTEDEVEIVGINNKIFNYVSFFQKIPHQVYLEILKSVNK